MSDNLKPKPDALPKTLEIAARALTEDIESVCILNHTTREDLHLRIRTAFVAFAEAEHKRLFGLPPGKTFQTPAGMIEDEQRRLAAKPEAKRIEEDNEVAGVVKPERKENFR